MIKFTLLILSLFEHYRDISDNFTRCAFIEDMDFSLIEDIVKILNDHKYSVNINAHKCMSLNKILKYMKEYHDDITITIQDNTTSNLNAFTYELKIY